MREAKVTTFDRLPIGTPFLLGEPGPRRRSLSFTKVSALFAESEEHRESRYYFYPEQKVYIARRVRA